MGALPNSYSGPPRLLLVDDDPVVRRVTATLLERRLGLVVTPAFGAMQALSLMRREPFDAVLVDLDMPEMGGLELVQRVRSLFPKVVIGVWSGRPVSDELDGSGARFFVNKGEKSGALIEALRSALDIDPLHSGMHVRTLDDAER